MYILYNEKLRCFMLCLNSVIKIFNYPGNIKKKKL